MPQPHSNLCPACNINGGGTGDSNNSSNGVLVVQFDEAFHQLTPGGVTIIRTGAGTTVVHDSSGTSGFDAVTEVVSEDLRTILSSTRRPSWWSSKTRTV